MNPNTAETRSSSSNSVIESIGARFKTCGQFAGAEEIPTGLINSTHCASYTLPSGEVRRYILQSINQAVFKDPLGVMRNLETVIHHQQARLAPGNAARLLSLVATHEGESWTQDAQGNFWRCYHFLEGCVTHDTVDTPHLAKQAARAFGEFQRAVHDLPPSLLAETLPGFHDTPLRFRRLLDTAAQDPHQRLASSLVEMKFITDRDSITTELHGLLESGQIPLRVVHNDTKINNVMLDAVTGDAVCVIDLDTVMPGMALHDFGDLVRSAANPAREDETDLTKVSLRLPIFEALAEGYLSATHGFLTDAEISNLVQSVKVITLELAIRFLTDHLAGDVYFKTDRENQNLDRCRTQLKLVASIEEQEEAMEAIVQRVLGKLRKVTA